MLIYTGSIQYHILLPINTINRERHRMFRKKPAQVTLEELEQTYNDCCNETIKNLTLEEENNVDDALKGWKSLHTTLLYKLDLFDKYSTKLEPQEKTLLNSLKSIRDENVKHLIRVQLRLDEKNRKLKRKQMVHHHHLLQEASETKRCHR